MFGRGALRGEVGVRMRWNFLDPEKGGAVVCWLWYCLRVSREDENYAERQRQCPEGGLPLPRGNFL